MGEISIRKRLTIAIDGPVGAGKSTVAKAIAQRLGYLYVDTGAMYRTVALKAKARSIGPQEEAVLSGLAFSLSIDFFSEGEVVHVLCDNQDVTEAIRDPEIGRLASDISKWKRVREALVEKQREMGRAGGVVLEGRDIGTVVFPDADLKFYLDADAEERGKRRFKEWTQKGLKVDFQKTLEDLTQRDHNDMHREYSPLKRADDAVLIDSTRLSEGEVVEEMLKLIRKKMEYTA